MTYTTRMSHTLKLRPKAYFDRRHTKKIEMRSILLGLILIVWISPSADETRATDNYRLIVGLINQARQSIGEISKLNFACETL